MECNTGKISRTLRSIQCSSWKLWHIFFNVLLQYINTLTTMQKLMKHEKIYRGRMKCCMCIQVIKSSHELNLGFNGGSIWADTPSAQGPWTNPENIIPSINAERVMSLSEWKVEPVKLYSGFMGGLKLPPGRSLIRHIIISLVFYISESLATISRTAACTQELHRPPLLCDRYETVWGGGEHFSTSNKVSAPCCCCCCCRADLASNRKLLPHTNGCCRFAQWKVSVFSAKGYDKKVNEEKAPWPFNLQYISILASSQTLCSSASSSGIY